MGGRKGDTETKEQDRTQRGRLNVREEKTMKIDMKQMKRYLWMEGLVLMSE